MKTIVKTILFSTLMFFSLITYGQEQKYVENEFIVWLEPHVDASSFAEQNDAGITPKRLLSKRLNIWLFEITDSKEPREAHMRRLSCNADVRLIQNNHTNIVHREVIPDDPYYYRQWAPAIMGLPQAWDEYTTGGVTTTGDTIVVAVIDGGADLNHEDLNFWKNTHEIPGNGIDDDGNGYIDDYLGWNAFNHNDDIPSNDHGTHVSGIIGASGNNGKGVCGINWNVQVMLVSGSSTTESVVVEAYSYVLEMRARYNETNGEEGAFIVATNSSFGVDYGHPEDYPIWCSMYDEMGQVGILSCCAGPNVNADVDVVGDIPSTCPGEYLIGITNTTSADTKSNTAGYGIDNIDIGAPGTSIYSAIPDNGYSNKTGTSMATPQVSGTIALMYAAMPETMMTACKNDPAGFCLLTRQSLLDGADHLTSLDGLVAESRRLNAHGAIERLLNAPTMPVLTGEAKVTGVTVVGKTLIAEINLSSTPVIPDLGELSYQWRRNATLIEGEVAPTYVLTQADTGAMISVQVIAKNCLGAVTSPAVGPIRPSNSGVTENGNCAFEAYPNPSTGSVTFEGNGPLTITNALGQTILIQELSNSVTLRLPKGLYFAKLGSVIKKIVVE